MNSIVEEKHTAGDHSTPSFLKTDDRKSPYKYLAEFNIDDRCKGFVFYGLVLVKEIIGDSGQAKAQSRRTRNLR